MSQDEAVAKFTSAVVALWSRWPPEEIAAMGRVTLAIEMDSAVLVRSPDGRSFEVKAVHPRSAPFDDREPAASGRPLPPW